MNNTWETVFSHWALDGTETGELELSVETYLCSSKFWNTSPKQDRLKKPR